MSDPAAPARRLGPPELVLLALTGAALAALGVLASVWLPAMAKMFADFGGPLPLPTRVVLAKAWAPGCVVTVASGAAAIALFLPRRPARVALLVACAAAALLVVAATVVALYLPIFQLAGAIRAD